MKSVRIALVSALVIGSVALAQAASVGGAAGAAGGAAAGAGVGGGATATTPAVPPAAAGAAGSTTAAGPAGTFTLSTADSAKLKTWIVDQKKVSVAAPAGFTVAVGAVVPASVTLNDIPASAGVTAATSVKFAVIADKMVLVNATDRKVVYIFA